MINYNRVQRIARSEPEFAAAYAGIGSLSFPSKMPGTAYGIPAQSCIAGKRLQTVADSVCSGCYALRGNYRYRPVRASQAARLAALDSVAWQSDFVFVLQRLRREGLRFHRWHDSGDLQSVAHGEAICNVATATPWLRHWLPTREYAMAAQLQPPENLVIRVSAAMINGTAPDIGLPTSTVHRNGGAHGKVCHAPKRGGNCGNCRACWNPSIGNVSYRKH